ncbi:MAG: hypothetical protein NTY53_23260 [Kiritimatiellaeota bacterium]|nr:hypothetical protein [Kiritimatiellota bacterium]
MMRASSGGLGATSFEEFLLWVFFFGLVFQGSKNGVGYFKSLESLWLRAYGGVRSGFPSFLAPVRLAFFVAFVGFCSNSKARNFLGCFFQGSEGWAAGWAWAVSVPAFLIIMGLSSLRWLL